jgi:hypothetical protein
MIQDIEFKCMPADPKNPKVPNLRGDVSTEKPTPKELGRLLRENK